MISDGKTIALRKGDTEGRSVYVYFNTGGVTSGKNEYVGHVDKWGADWKPDDVAHSAVKVTLPTIPGATAVFDEKTGWDDELIERCSPYYPINVKFYGGGEELDLDHYPGADKSKLFRAIKFKIDSNPFEPITVDEWNVH